MAPNKSLDPYKQIIVTLLRDVQVAHSDAIDQRALRLTQQYVERRCALEGVGFLTKTLPSLGKALDRALSSHDPIDVTSCRFSTIRGTKLPRFLGELFSKVLSSDGTPLESPCANSVKSLRLVLFVFYKLELPNSPKLEQKVLDRFLQIERDLVDWNQKLRSVAKLMDMGLPLVHNSTIVRNIVLTARRRLSRLFSTFDQTNIVPRHGPGVVSTKEKLWDKYRFTNVSPRITESYPLDTYYYVSLGHVCDRLQVFLQTGSEESFAKIILVPKDSRGPRLISCEPLDFQWIQQGLGRAIVSHVERHPLTRYNVHFTDQNPNRRGALLGSSGGGYATLDLSDASDRVSIGLVELLFPEPLLRSLMNCRSLGTQLPDGQKLLLHKFAPMGSALCFPILALVVWSLLTAAADADTREGILVYGDDVIVPEHFALHAIAVLEAFGLKVNRSKSCTDGLFRESCGMDAFNGVDVTPLRIRTQWSSSPRPGCYSSYVAYANTLYSKHCYHTYDFIVGLLYRTYGGLVSQDMNITSCPSLIDVPEAFRVKRKRTNKDLQKSEFYVLCELPVRVMKSMDGWSMLLRYFAEARSSSCRLPEQMPRRSGVVDDLIEGQPFSAGLYTIRRRSVLRRMWR